MNEEYLRNCSYQELKQIALENDILKNIKSKKKDVLLQRIKDFFSSGSSLTDNDINALNNEEILEISSKRKNKKSKSDTDSAAFKKVTYSIESKENFPESLNVSQRSENYVRSSKAGKRGKNQNQSRNTMTESSEENVEFPDKPIKSNGRKTRSKKGNFEGTLKDQSNINDVSDTNKIIEADITCNLESDESCKVLPVDKNCENTVPLKKGRKRGKKADVTSNFTESSEDNEVSPEKSLKSNGRKTRSKDSGGNSTSKIMLNQTVSGNPKVVGKDLIPEENRRETFTLVSSKEPISSSHTPSRSQNKKQKVSELDSSRGSAKTNKQNSTFNIESEKKKEILNVDQNNETIVPSKKGRKRGRKLDLTQNSTVELNEENSVSTDKLVESKGRKTRSKDTATTTEKVPLNQNNDLSADIFETAGKEIHKEYTESPKRNRTRSKEANKNVSETCMELPLNQNNLLNNLPEGPVPVENRRGTFSVASKNPPVSSPLLANQSQVKSKVAKFVKDTANIINKTVNFLTPDNKKSTPRNTPKRSNIVLTPHPTKKSLSTPLAKKSISSPFSVKKTPGQFSARKMPNFAKIHQKSFKKMESLVQYSERKIARAEFLSPLKGSAVQNKMIKRQSEVIEKNPSKSLIPIRSKVSLKENAKIKAFGNKTHLTNVDTIREKEKNIIKGVRANKRFLLQMKMRGLET